MDKRTQSGVIKKIRWVGLGCICLFVSVLVFLPADWLALVVEHKTQGRLTLGDAQGSLWSGSAFIGVISSAGTNAKTVITDSETPIENITALLPGRFVWHLSPLIILGYVDIVLENAESLQHPVKITGNWGQVVVSSSSLLVPAQRLSSLGAPLNTLQPTGQMHLSWSELMIQPSTEGVDLNGKFTLSMSAIASALSPIKPLGSYLMTFDYYGKKAQLMLSTKQGPLLLAGRGSLDHGHLQFSGQASAQAGQEEKLANLLNLLGQRRVDGAKNVIALEFK